MLTLSKFIKQISKFDYTESEIEAHINTFMAQSNHAYGRDMVAKKVYSVTGMVGEQASSAASQLRKHSGYAESLNMVAPTPKQINYLAKLLDEIGDEVEWHLSENEPLSRQKASAMIDVLK